MQKTVPGRPGGSCYPGHARMGGAVAGRRAHRGRCCRRGLLDRLRRRYKAAVANVIPPQKAGRVADLAGVADRTGWCPVDPVTFRLELQPNIHVIGDAAIASAMPQLGLRRRVRRAKICAAALSRLLGGRTPPAPTMTSSCYSLVAPDYGIIGRRKAPTGQSTTVSPAPRRSVISPPDAPRATRWSGRTMADGLVSDHHRRGVRLKGASRILVLPLRSPWRRVAGAGRAAALQVLSATPFPASLTGKPGRRRARAVPSWSSAKVGLCLLCHSGPFPGSASRATWRRSLKGAGRA